MRKFKNNLLHFFISVFFHSWCLIAVFNKNSSYKALKIIDIYCNLVLIKCYVLMAADSWGKMMNSVLLNESKYLRNVKLA